MSIEGFSYSEIEARISYLQGGLAKYIDSNKAHSRGPSIDRMYNYIFMVLESGLEGGAYIHLLDEEEEFSRTVSKYGSDSTFAIIDKITKEEYPGDSRNAEFSQVIKDYVRDYILGVAEKIQCKDGMDSYDFVESISDLDSELLDDLKSEFELSIYDDLDESVEY